MISPEFFVRTLAQGGVDFYTGVPDSLLKQICAYLTDNMPSERNIIAANEGGAMGIAAGYYLATGRTPVVYMQNSGLGNTVNPLMSLTDPEVYNIPVLLLIGWRGEPGKHDEPQHVKQGRVTLPLLDAMEIRHAVLSENESECGSQIEAALEYMTRTREPYALVVRKGTFGDYKLQNAAPNDLSLNREEAIRLVVENLSENSVVVGTTGMISRELFEIREARGEGHERDFLTVGSMGHASQIALGIALERPNFNVYCFDGDGAALMHLGSMAITASQAPANYRHIIFNNGAHDSVGGQPTVALSIDLPTVAKAVGYRSARSVSDAEGLQKALAEMQNEAGPTLLEVKVRRGARKDLGRPTTTPIQNKEALMAYLKR